MTILSERQKESHKRWMRDWADRLAYCYYCDGEYTDAQVVVHEEEKSCPHCKNPERKTYYYCEEHGSSDDDCER